jgi:hypothetical protein
MYPIERMVVWSLIVAIVVVWSTILFGCQMPLR